MPPNVPNRKEPLEYSNAFSDLVSVPSLKRVGMRRDFYAFLVRMDNLLTNRMSCIPLNWLRYQIRTKVTGAVSVSA